MWYINMWIQVKYFEGNKVYVNDDIKSYSWVCLVSCVAVCCSVLQWCAFCSVLRCAAVCCGCLQCFAVCCSVLQCVAAYFGRQQALIQSRHKEPCWSVSCVVVVCSMLQCVAAYFRRQHALGQSWHNERFLSVSCVAVCCGALKCVAVCCSIFSQVISKAVTTPGAILKCVLCCSVLQCVEVFSYSRR